MFSEDISGVCLGVVDGCVVSKVFFHCLDSVLDVISLTVHHTACSLASSHEIIMKE